PCSPDNPDELRLCVLPGPPTPHIYTLSLHDALPILLGGEPDVRSIDDGGAVVAPARPGRVRGVEDRRAAEAVSWARPLSRDQLTDRKSTRLNSSHDQISYAVFCLKKKKEKVDISSDI